MRYLFLSGSPRSGTSALTELLSSHPDVALGMERYKHLYRKGAVRREMFEEAKFFRFAEDETNIDGESGKYVEYYRSLRAKFDACTVRGDKYPQLYKFLPALHAEFGDEARFIMIVRDVHDVASSFNVRALNPKDSWPAENTYAKAVELWNASLQAATSAIEGGLPLFVVRYERLFDTEQSDVNAQRVAMLEAVGIEDSTALQAAHVDLCERYVVDVKPKPRTVLERQDEYIEANADYSALRRLEAVARAA